MNGLFAALAIWLAGGLGALLAGSSPAWATRLGAGSAVLGSLAGLYAVVSALAAGATPAMAHAWSVPFGAFSVGLDGLSAFFLLPTLALIGLAAVYGGEYLLSYGSRRNLGVPWLLYDWMAAGMVLVLIAKNALLFLMGWEVMTLGAVFLVSFDDGKQSVRAAGWIYLTASHIATAFLLVFFLSLGRDAATLDFADIVQPARPPVLAGALFLCAAVGFGTKAGLIPFHVWLPEAHPAAPSHVSALLSALVLKTGVYGLMRGLTLLGEFQEWWGWGLMGVGLTSALLGILFGMAQQDLKRLLAYSSVENIGIIFIGIGMGVLGVSRQAPVLAVLGFCGALLHALNHALAKGMLFLNAGAVLHATGSKRLDQLGGLLKTLPWEGALFLVGAVSLCALPPMNGFLGEFWIYMGIFKLRGALGPAALFPGMFLLAGLALAGGLAAVSYSKAFGGVFLGQPRKVVDAAAAARAHKPGWAMRLPMLALALGCAALVPLFPLAARMAGPAVQIVSGLGAEEVWAQTTTAQASAWPLSLAAFALMILIAALLVVRKAALRKKTVTAALTWDCGYALPARRMQYTPTSYSQPVTVLFSLFLRPRRHETAPEGLFPRAAAIASDVPDPYLEKIYRPLFAWIEARLARWRWIQHGRLQAYILYVSLSLLFLLAWKLW